MMDLTIIMPIIAASSVVFLILLKIYLKMREYFPVSVECWFCCKKTKVPFREANSWECLNCNQYNGFLDDGDYNRLIPSQYDELLNVPRYTSNARDQCNGMRMRSSPTLCANCNNNQQMKIAQLAMFLPFNPRNFDMEIENYSEQLERIYGICGSCEATVAEVLKKQSKLHGLKSPSSEKNKSSSKVHPVTVIRRPLLFTHYATLLLGVVLFYSSTRNIKQVVSFQHFITNQLHNSMKVLPNFAFVEEKVQLFSLVAMNSMNRFYTWIPSDMLNNLTFSTDYVTIWAFIVVYALELLRMRNTNSLLNTGTWIILLSLKISSTAPEYLISIMQAVVAVVFIYISFGTLRMEKSSRMKMKMRKEKKNKFLPTKQNGVTKAKAPVCSDNYKSKTQIAQEDSALISEKTTKKSPATVHSLNLSNISQKDTSSLKPKSHNDFGLSDLSLGPRETGSTKNHLTSEPRPYCGRLNDQIWSRSTVLSPSRLNMDTVDSPFTTNASPPRSRSLNDSSGRGSIASNQPESVCGDTMYDKFTPTVKLTVANMAANQGYTSTSHQRNYCDLYPSSEFSYPALSHYHFTAAQMQRSYPSTPPSTIFLNNSNSSPANANYNSLLPYSPFPFYPFPQFQTTSLPSITETDSNKHSVFHNVIFPVLVSILIVCNLALLGLVSYKELSVKNSAT